MDFEVSEERGPDVGHAVSEVIVRRVDDDLGKLPEGLGPPAAQTGPSRIVPVGLRGLCYRHETLDFFFQVDVRHGLFIRTVLVFMVVTGVRRCRLVTLMRFYSGANVWSVSFVVVVTNFMRLQIHKIIENKTKKKKQVPDANIEMKRSTLALPKLYSSSAVFLKLNPPAKRTNLDAK